MATYQENLITARDNCAVKLAAVMSDSAHKPDYSVEGVSISWAAYCDMLSRQLDKLNGQIQAADGPFEIVNRAFW